MAWTPDSGLISFGGGPIGGSSVILNVTINPATSRYGQITHVGNWNVGSGTVNVTISPTTPAIPAGTTFDVIKVSGTVNFVITAPIPGFTSQNNVDLGGGVHSIRLIKS